MNMPTQPALVRVARAAKLLGVAVPTFRRYVLDGTVPARFVVHVNGQRFLTLPELKQWADSLPRPLGSKEARPRRSVEERNALVLQWLRLPGRVLSDFRRRCPEVSPLLRRMGEADLMQAATVGLIKAATLYDESRGFRFTTFACAAIWRHIDLAVRREKKHRWRQMPEDPDLAAALAVSRDRGRAERLDLRAALSVLDRRSRQLLTDHLGIGEGPALSDRALAARHGISPSRVCQIIHRAKDKVALQLLRAR